MLSSFILQRRTMRCFGIWCVWAGLLGYSVLAQLDSASREGNSDSKVQWIEKRTHILHHVKRKTVCPADLTLCPPSVNGGCCPNGFQCGTALCSAGPTQCNGVAGMYSCPTTIAPGQCCPVGYACDTNGCRVPPGLSFTQSCDASYFACPLDQGGGCCANGRICSRGLCHNTAPMTLPVLSTTTRIGSEGNKITTTITITTTYTAPIDSTKVIGVPEVISGTIAKVVDSQTNDSSKRSGGLSPGALGGIIAGVVVVGVVVIVAATFIVIRLKNAEKAAKSAEQAVESKHGSSNGNHRSHKSGFGQPTVSEIDSNTDVDPPFPIMYPSPQMRSRSTTFGTADRSISRTPNLPTPGSSPPPGWDMAYDHQSNPDSYPRQFNPRRMSQTVSMDSQGRISHSRDPSDASELEAATRVPEIQTFGGINDRPGQQWPSNSLTQAHMRRDSDLSSHGRARGDSNTGSSALRTVNEAQEIYGGHYYGPEHSTAGYINSNHNPPTGGSSSRGQDT